MANPQARYEFALRPSLTLRTSRIGQEGEPVMLVDDVLADPRALIDYAATQVRFDDSETGGAGYPGIRAPAPLNYVDRVVRALDPLIRETFGLGEVALANAECALSMVTTPPAALHPLQRVPHYDTSYPLQFAILHYLCDARFGGTAFYRHNQSGYELISPSREAAYLRARDAELAAAPPPPEYVAAQSPLFTRIVGVEAAFNRVIVYRSCALHSGQIPPAMPLLADPRTGRLTANIFLSYGLARG